VKISATAQKQYIALLCHIESSFNTCISHEDSFYIGTRKRLLLVTKFTRIQNTKPKKMLFGITISYDYCTKFALPPQR
jgi:hypothetical protein